MAPNDKWDDLPNVVEQLKAEAASAPLKPRKKPVPVAPPAAATPAPARRDDWAERLTADDDRTIIRPRAVAAAAGGVATPPPTSPTHTDPSEDDDADDESGDDPDAEPTWPGVPDYDERAADPALDPRQLLERLSAEADRALGPRAKVMRPLFEQLGRQLDELLTKPAPAATLTARQAELSRALDKLEDLFAALMVSR